MKPPKVEAVLLFGPQRQPPDYQHVMKLVSEEQALDAAMLEWMRASRLEWNEISGHSSEFRPARFVWTSASGRGAQQWIGSSEVSVMWRVVARRAQDVARLVGSGLLSVSESKRQAVAGHLQAATDAARTLCNSQRASVQPLLAS